MPKIRAKKLNNKTRNRQRRRINELSNVCAELYQVIGSMAEDLGAFDHPHVIKALDNASGMAMIHHDVLPFPALKTDQSDTRPAEFNTGDPLLDQLLTNTHYLAVNDAEGSASLWQDSLTAYQQSKAGLNSKKTPELTVWYGKMPESNGKSNWTAMLHRAGESGLDALTNGFTFARSEYPDRVRYDADSMRYLIGAIDQEPCVMDYDDQKCDAPPL